MEARTWTKLVSGGVGGPPAHHSTPPPPRENHRQPESFAYIPFHIAFMSSIQIPKKMYVNIHISVFFILFILDFMRMCILCNLVGFPFSHTI